jgi:uncharacterized protein YdaU (DUF1376 family)
MRIDPLVEKRTHPSCRSFFSGWILGRGKMHFYQFHIGDYKSHTHHLSLIEDLAFRRLLDHYYLHEAPIKQRDIARQIGMKDNEQEVLTVLNEFFISTDQGFINPRADEEIAKYRKFSEDGKKGAAKRWHKGTNGEAYSPPIATPIATNNHKPITNNHKPNIRATVVAMPDGISQSVWDEFVKHRKSKKAQVTQLVIDGIQKEAEIAGFTLEDALKEIVLRNWQSFKADWVVQKQNVFNKVDIARVTVPSSQNRDPALVKLDEDRLKTAPPNPEVLAKIRAVLGRTA